MQYKVVDKTAPRFTRTKFQTKLVIKELHEEFVKSTGSHIDYQTFRLLYETNMDVIRDFITKERNGVALPVQMGNIHLAFFKRKRKIYDYMTGMATGEAPVEHAFHSDNLPGKIFWDFKTIKYKPRDFRLFGFKGCRELTQAASKAFINTPELFRKYIYKKGEHIKRRRLNLNERNNKRSDQSTEGSQQSGEL